MKGQPERFVNGHNRRGLDRPDLGDGRYLNRDGYVLVYVGSHPLYGQPGRYAFEHRLVIEEELGRRLTRREHVHHLNGIKADNRRANLELTDWVAHGTRHGHPKDMPLSPAHRAKMPAAARAGWETRRRKAAQ